WQGKRSIHMERAQRLARIGMVWENTDPWGRKFELAKQYYEEHGNLRMPADYVVEGVWLDRWLREQKARWEQEGCGGEDAVDSSENIGRQQEEENDLQNQETSRKSSKSLTAEQKDKLLSIGIKPGVSQAELSWREQYGEAEEFYRRHGNLSISKRYATSNGKNLGIWLQHQRVNRRNGRLSGWQITMLDGIGMVWEFPDAWEVGFAHAEEYAHRMGNLEVPNAYICADGYRLGKWISNQRCMYGGCVGKGLEWEKIRKLEKIGMIWNAKRGRNCGSLPGNVPMKKGY
ncbi:MAG: helicase associated domain-containing protein, partial [Lachnospiraceae bacterium]|nr:helicase associated domain-containing protein [Lachnospiraceae bacterium]